MRRRELLTMIAATAAARPLAARAQRPAMPVIGYLGSATAKVYAGRLRAFRQGLGETGFVEGRNVTIEYRWAEGHYDRFPALAADLVRRRVTVIATPGSTPAAIAAKAATSTIPIVFLTATDPVKAGLVASLNRPGGNLTGVTALSLELGPKQLELLRELVPAATTFALLVNPTSPLLAGPQSKELLARAHTLGLRLHVLNASAERDFEPVFARLAELRVGGLLIGGETLFTSRSRQLAALALRHSVPAIYQFRQFAAGGGLMSYGVSLAGAHRLAGVITARILGGKKAAELPVERATKFELVVNLKTAKALGLAVPVAILARADEVIE